MYLKKNVNIMLLIMILTILIGTVAITTYFKSTYQTVSEDLEQKNEQLLSVSSNFTSKIGELNKTASELQLRQLDKEKLDQLYGDLLKQKAVLDAELTATHGKLADSVTELDRKKKELSDANYQLLLQEDELADLNKKVQNQLDTIRSKGVQIDNLNTQIDSLKKQLCDEKTAQGKPC